MIIIQNNQVREICEGSKAFCEKYASQFADTFLKLVYKVNTFDGRVRGLYYGQDYNGIRNR